MAQAQTDTDAAVSNLDAPGALEGTGIPSLDAKLARLDDDLNPIDEDGNIIEEDDDTPPDPGKNDEPEDEEDAEELEDEADEEEPDEEDQEEEEPEEKPKKGGKKTEEDDEEGYTIDDDEEEPVVDKPEPPAPEKPANQLPAGVSEEDAFIINGIKDMAFTVRGTVGSDTEVKEFKILTVEQLPAGFKYADDVMHDFALKQDGRVEQKAAELKSQFARDQQQKTTNDVTRREEQSERHDLKALQESGDIPMFRKNPDVPNGFKGGFREILSLLSEAGDDGAKTALEVLDFKDKKNQQYWNDYQKGNASYRHIGLEEAFAMFKRTNPTKSNPEQKREDKQRKLFAKRTANTRSGTRGKEVNRKMHSGMSGRDLDLYIESLSEDLS